MRPRSGSIELVAALVALTLALAGCERVREWRGSQAAVVTDVAGLLSEEQRAHMERVHGLLRADHDLDYRVELVEDVGDLDRYAHARFAELGVGSRSEAARGLLLVLDATQDLVRMEVGQGLEGVFPDAFVAYLEHRQMLPYFRAGQVGDGVLATTELLVTRIQNAKARAGWDAEPWAAGSAGAGARARAQLGRGRDDSFSGGPDVPSGSTPAETVRAYLAAMATRNGNPEMDLYTTGTRAMLAGRVITPAQMDSVARAYRACRRQSLRLAEDGTHAVVRYPVEARVCAPFLLVLEGGRWRLDFETAARAIRFGRGNAWHLVREQAGPYAFAFDDWRFDRHGYPHAKADG
jgi:uncharacterized protein